MEGIDHVQNTLEESARTRYESMTASERKYTSDHQTNSGVMLSRAVTSVAISAYGRKVDEIHRDLENIEDPEERRKATEGMRKAMIHTAAKTDAGESMEFVESVSRLKEKDEAVFTGVFRTAGELSEEGYDIGQWMDAVLRIEEPAMAGAFIEETGRILQAVPMEPERRLQTVSRLVHTVSSILDARLGERGGLGLMEQLFEGLATTEGLEARNTYMNLYVEDHLK